MPRKKKQVDCPAAPIEPEGQLVILTRDGFGNRIRTVAAAWALAAEVGRQLHISWEVDDSCGAAFEDLFATRLATGDTVRMNTLTALSTRVYRDEGHYLKQDAQVSCYQGKNANTASISKAPSHS